LCSQQKLDLLFNSYTFCFFVRQNMNLPTLARYEEESLYIKGLQEEMEQLNVRLNAALNVTTSASTHDSEDNLCEGLDNSLPTPQPPTHLMDDFYNIAQ